MMEYSDWLITSIQLFVITLCGTECQQNTLGASSTYPNGTENFTAPTTDMSMNLITNNRFDVQVTATAFYNTTRKTYTDVSFVSTSPVATISNEESAQPGAEENSHNETISTNVTSNDVEELLQTIETTAFLNGIRNDAKRSVVMEQLRYCPYLELCAFSFNLTLPKDNVSACAPCSCPGGNSYLSGKNSCPDALDFNTFGVIHTEPYDCFPMYIKDPKVKPDGDRKLYNVTHRCPNAYGRLQLCDTGEGRDKTFLDILPVTDRETNFTYINMPCAVCNNVKEENLVLWEITVSCDEREGQTYTTETDLINFILERPSCNLKYWLNKHEDERAAICPPRIRKCNETGNWETFDPFILAACLFYENLYLIEVGEGYARYIFRNVFCAICNGFVPHIYTVYAFESRVKSPSQIYSFSGLLKLNVQSEKTTTESDCPQGFLYDVVKKDCVDLLCSPLRKLEGDRCDLIYTDVAGVVYVFTARVYPIGNQDVIISSRWMLELFEAFFYDKFFSNYSVQNEAYSSYSNLCYKAARANMSDVCYATGSFSVSCHPRLDYYDIELHTQITQYHSLDHILGRYTYLTGSTDLVLQQEMGFKVLTFRVKLQAIENISSQTMFVSKSSNNCSRTAERIQVSLQSDCAFIELKSTDYDWVAVGNNVFLNASDYVSLNETQFQIGPNRTSLFLCSNVYKSLFPIAQALKIDSGQTFGIESVVSVVCVSVSLLCLLMSLITFCLFPCLQSLPGKNNISLIVTLLCAQTSYLVSSYSKFEQNSPVCIITGIFTHLFWLMSMFFMNVCTFHVFRVFSGIGNITHGRGMKTLVIYWSYVIFVSAIFVSVNILVSLFNSDYNDIGYGNISCYINRKHMVIITFGIPVGLVVVTNFIMFLSVMCKIRNMPTIRRDVKNERSDITIFVKLSTLTGFCWIFGFLYLWTDIQAFSYLFIVMNASQGVFLFLSFVCTRNVLLMYRDRFASMFRKSVSFKTKSTDSKMPGNKFTASL